jgi:hypothetical protein
MILLIIIPALLISYLTIILVRYDTECNVHDKKVERRRSQEQKQSDLFWSCTEQVDDDGRYDIY